MEKIWVGLGVEWKGRLGLILLNFVDMSSKLRVED